MPSAGTSGCVGAERTRLITAFGSLAHLTYLSGPPALYGDLTDNSRRLSDRPIDT